MKLLGFLDGWDQTIRDQVKAASKYTTGEFITFSVISLALVALSLIPVLGNKLQTFLPFMESRGTWQMYNEGGGGTLNSVVGIGLLIYSGLCVLIGLIIISFLIAGLIKKKRNG